MGNETELTIEPHSLSLPESTQDLELLLEALHALNNTLDADTALPPNADLP